MKLRAAREQVLTTCLALADRGYLAATGGNVAFRLDETQFAVTPSAVDYYAMTPSDVCIVRISDEQQLAGDRQASVESGLHAAVFRRRPGCRVSLHTHQPIASAYSLLSRPLEVRDANRRSVLGAIVPLVEYAPSGTAWLATQASATFGPLTHACLMRNHGVVCVGDDWQEAIARVIAVEAECAAFFQARARGTIAPVAAALVRRALDAELERGLR